MASLYLNCLQAEERNTLLKGMHDGQKVLGQKIDLIKMMQNPDA